MTIILNLSPEIETQLIKQATKQGKDISVIASEIITHALELELKDYQEAIKGIETGLNDFEIGNFRNFEDFATEQSQKYNLSLE